MLVITEPKFVLNAHGLRIEAPVDMTRREVVNLLMDVVGDMLLDRKEEAAQAEDELAYLRLESAERTVRFAAATVDEVDQEVVKEIACVNADGQLGRDLTGLDRRKFPLRAVIDRETTYGEQYDTLECQHVHKIPEGHPLDSQSRRCGECYVESLND